MKYILIFCIFLFSCGLFEDEVDIDTTEERYLDTGIDSLAGDSTYVDTLITEENSKDWFSETYGFSNSDYLFVQLKVDGDSIWTFQGDSNILVSEVGGMNSKLYVGETISNFFDSSKVEVLSVEEGQDFSLGVWGKVNNNYLWNNDTLIIYTGSIAPVVPLMRVSKYQPIIEPLYEWYHYSVDQEWVLNQAFECQWGVIDADIKNIHTSNPTHNCANNNPYQGYVYSPKLFDSSLVLIVNSPNSFSTLEYFTDQELTLPSFTDSIHIKLGDSRDAWVQYMNHQLSIVEYLKIPDWAVVVERPQTLSINDCLMFCPRDYYPMPASRWMLDEYNPNIPSDGTTDTWKIIQENQFGFRDTLEVIISIPPLVN